MSADLEVTLTSKGNNPMQAFSGAKAICKTFISVRFGVGDSSFSMAVSVDSNLSDLMEIYRYRSKEHKAKKKG